MAKLCATLWSVNKDVNHDVNVVKLTKTTFLLDFPMRDPNGSVVSKMWQWWQHSGLGYVDWKKKNLSWNFSILYYIYIYWRKSSEIKIRSIELHVQN